MKKEKKENLIEIEYDYVPLYKRFFSAIIDIFITIFLALILTLSSLFIYTNSSIYKESISSINTVIEDSSLYIKSNEEYILISDYYENNKTISNNEKRKDLDKRVNYFYINLNCYSDISFFGNNLLNELKLEYGNNLFYKDEISNEIKEKVDALDKDFVEFYIYIINENAIGYLLQNDIYKNETNKIFIFQIILLVSSIIISVLIFYLFIPLIIKRGNKTIGKLIFRFGNLKVNGFSLSKKDFLIKFLYFFFLEFLLSLFTFFIPLLISIGMMMFSISHQNLNEYLSQSYSLSNENKKFYLNYEEYLYSKKKNEGR